MPNNQPKSVLGLWQPKFACAAGNRLIMCAVQYEWPAMSPVLSKIFKAKQKPQLRLAGSVWCHSASLWQSVVLVNIFTTSWWSKPEFPCQQHCSLMQTTKLLNMIPTQSWVTKKKLRILIRGIMSMPVIHVFPQFLNQIFTDTSYMPEQSRIMTILSIQGHMRTFSNVSAAII